MHVTLGNRYRDSISGFEGVATARYEYLHGCVRILLTGEYKDGKVEDLVVDEQQLIDVAEDTLVTPQATSGGPADDVRAHRPDPSPR